MGHFKLLIAITAALSLGACSTYTPVPIAPDEPVAELYGTGNFAMTSPVMDPKGCYQTNMRIESQPMQVRANKPLVVAIDGSVGIYRCRDMVKFRPQAGHRYVVHGLPGRDDTAPKTSMFQRAASANTEHCHIEIFDETNEGEAQRLSVQRTEPRQKGFACITF